MLDLRQKTFSKLKKYLLRRQKDVKQQLESIEINNPVSGVDLVAEASEAGTESWLAEAHGRLTAVKNDLVVMSFRIKDSLLRIKKGTYGKCENCGKPIETERLEAIPIATLCLDCAKKPPKKSSRKS